MWQGLWWQREMGKLQFSPVYPAKETNFSTENKTITNQVEAKTPGSVAIPGGQLHVWPLAPSWQVPPF